MGSAGFGWKVKQDYSHEIEANQQPEGLIFIDSTKLVTRGPRPPKCSPGTSFPSLGSFCLAQGGSCHAPCPPNRLCKLAPLALTAPLQQKIAAHHCERWGPATSGGKHILHPWFGATKRHPFTHTHTHLSLLPDFLTSFWASAEKTEPNRSSMPLLQASHTHSHQWHFLNSAH